LTRASARSWAIPTRHGGTSATASSVNDASIQFDPARLRTGLEVVANRLGKKLDEDNPLLNAQLPDGSRLAAVIPPVVRPAPAMVIRKFTSRHFTVEDLIARGTLTRPLAEFLAAQIERGQTILISGGTGTGKTTLLNILGQSIPDHERIVVIEDTAELRIEKPNIMAVECQTDTYRNAVTFDDLLKAALRWRPDRIIPLARYAESRRARYSIPSTLATPVRSPLSMPTRPQRHYVALQISFCAATLRQPSRTLKPRSERPSITSSMLSASLAVE
jgi:energy-coupling factor transporter ATP-binding protein EcfA2